MKYELDDMPKAGPLLLYGVQWFIILLPCVIIMGIVVARLHYPDAAAHMWYMRKLLALMGGVTILQVLIGHRLPLVVGPATALLVALLASVAAGVEAIYTSICLGGLVLAFLAYSGCLSRIRFFFTPRIITVILMLIAFTLAPTILRLSFPDPEHPVFHLFFALIVVLALVLCNKVLPGIWKSMTIPCGIAGGCAAYFAVFGLPQLAEIGNAEGLNLFIAAPVFDFGTILCFLFCFLALIINELGSIEALGHMLRVPDMDRRIKLGTGMQGLGNIAAGSLGVIGPVDFSMSAGIVAATGCASRYTLLPAGLALIACAFSPQAAVILNAIPNAVMGALLLYLMASQLASGLSMLTAEQCVTDFNSGIIVGLPLMTGLFIAFAPTSTWEHLPALLRPIIGNGFIMGTLTVIVLEHVIFRVHKKSASS